MTLDVYKEYLNMPPAQSLLDKITRDLKTGISVILVVPPGIDSNYIYSKVDNYFWHSSVTFRDISLQYGCGSKSAVEIISNVFCDTSKLTDSPVTISYLLECNSLPDIINISQLNEKTFEEQKTWMDFFRRWARESQSNRNIGGSPPALFTIVNDPFIIKEIPPNEYLITSYWWWNTPSILEDRLLCRIGNSDEPDRTKAIWREYLIPSLAIGDLSLINLLWDIERLSPQRLKDCLLEYGKSKNWGNEWIDLANEINVPNNTRTTINTDSPPKTLQPYVSLGILSKSPEYGLEFHSSYLALNDQTEEILHRLWRGQAELLLPLVDNLRLSICKIITGRFGVEWPYRWEQPESEEQLIEITENPLAVQYGYLEHLLRNCRQLSNFRYLLSLVQIAREIRNQIAHYKPIEFQKFSALSQEMERINQEFGM